MNDVTLELINDVANSPFAYLIMFIFLLSYVLKSSQQREDKMREQLDKIVPILDNLVIDVNEIKNNLKGRDF